VHFVLVCTEWCPLNGGLPQFNRSLALALARRGERVTCLVALASNEERADAEEHGVALEVPVIPPAMPNLFAPVHLDDAVDVVIGHDRHTGSEAIFHARIHWPGATLLLFIHTNPDELEVLKPNPDRVRRAQERVTELRRLTSHADVVCAIGPRLVRKVGSILDDGYGGKPVFRVDPGLTEPITAVARVVSPECICLLMGRAGDIAIKGIDIAARAFGHLSLPIRKTIKPVLLLRGASPGDAGRPP
jgi:hypothetical protein